ncbi:hypothetical protein [Burkholderia stagnalis]|uniref:hypothetical protein n=1 Tax=Burkholderia stagnalis TaxID=1503054 RepID=UPI001E2B3140|nr:hypothetical protein [Burkholderia stagnalis]
MTKTREVLDWRNRAQWLDAASKYARHLLTPAVRRTLARTRPSCWSDDMSWLPDWEDVFPEFVHSLSEHYAHLKAFHGCRPLSLSSYYAHGLRGQDADQLVLQFQAMFPEVPATDLNAAIGSLGDRSTRERGAIWLVGDDREMIEQYGHYIIQGSEYLMALAAHLGVSPRGEDYRFLLRERGIPTVLEVDIPIEIVQWRDIEEVAKMVLSVWGQEVTKRRVGSGPSPCYVIRRTIDAQYIRNHTHPDKIPDPHRGYIQYRNRQRTCDLCAADTGTEDAGAARTGT